MNEEQFRGAARAMATEFLNTVAQNGLSKNETANLAGAALSEVLAQQMGPFEAVTRLRDLADVLEKQLLEGAGIN
jgi:hypothetical protein